MRLCYRRKEWTEVRLGWARHGRKVVVQVEEASADAQSGFVAAVRLCRCSKVS